MNLYKYSIMQYILVHSKQYNISVYEFNYDREKTNKSFPILHRIFTCI